MIVLKGEGVNPGIAFGTLMFLDSSDAPPEKKVIIDPEKEWQRFIDARRQADEQLQNLYVKTLKTLGKEKSFLFEIHKMMLSDQDFTEDIQALIEKELVNAEYAVYKIGKKFASEFGSLDDAYMKARAVDVQDISQRVIRILTGAKEKQLFGNEPIILAADDLTPSETARLDKDKVLAFITSEGAANSHTAIFARTLGIPAIVALKDQLDGTYDGKQVFVDGESGKVFINPDESTTKEMKNKAQEEKKHKELLVAFKGKPAITKNGTKVALYANIGSPDDMEYVLKNDAEGIGLFRSEFLYLIRDDYPTEEEQFNAYKEVVEAMGDKPVTIRTLDIGADKQAKYFDLPEEVNPALGLRAIRICLTRPEIFKIQLRALYRAASYGNVQIMLPMITSLDEIRHAKDIVNQVKEELQNEGVKFNPDTPLGIMIETPAAALISDELASHVDFFSIGTNDLTQYTLAMDRENPNIASFLNPYHKAVLRLMEITAKNAKKNNIPVSICGELAADTKLTEKFLSMGITKLSMNPPFILELKAHISEL